MTALQVSELFIIGLMGNTNRGYMQGGVLCVVGHSLGAVLPYVEPKAWVEYGPDHKYDRVTVDVSPDRALSLRDNGWLEECGNRYATRTYRMTEKAWAVYNAAEKAIEAAMQGEPE